MAPAAGHAEVPPQQQQPGGQQQLDKQQQQQQPDKQQQQQQRKPGLEELYLQVRDKPCRVVDIRIEENPSRGVGGGGDGGSGSGPDGGGGGSGSGLQAGGLNRTAPKPLRLKREILERELDRVYEAATLKEVHEALERSVDVLRQLEVFEDITALIGAQPLEEPDTCSISLSLSEARWYAFKAGTYTQGGEYSVEGAASFRNLMGVADQWSVTGEIGTRKSRNFAAAFRLPRCGGGPLTPELRVFQAINNQGLHSSWEEALRGVSLGVTSAEIPGLYIGYEYGWRNLSSNPRASRAVQSQAGDYLKAALRGSYVWQAGGWARGEVLPTEGYQFRLGSEVGGLGPGATSLRYVRTQGHLSWAAAFADGLSLHIEAGTGLLLPGWAPSEVLAAKPSPLPERFYLGGVESNLRGFETRGIGPSEPRRGAAGANRRGSAAGASSSSSGADGGASGAAAGAGGAAGGGAGAADAITRDALGGDLFANVYAALMLRLPGQLGDLGAHAHVFANGGSAALLHSGGGAAAVGGAAAAAGSSSGSSGGSGGALGALGARLREGVGQMGRSFRWSTGVGLVWPTTLGRLELNYCWVLTAQEHDRLRRGLSFGFAANMGL